MTSKQTQLIQEPIFNHFHKLCQIPRRSHHETQVSNYLLHWAEEHGLHAEQDAEKNVFIRKPASPGYENSPCVMLQAHMDMVCEKAPHSDHNFETDPIQWQIEGDRINTNGQTTLGADNGIGVAYALSVLEDNSLKHPELEVLFTAAEEDDFSGAAGFDVAKMRATRLINLDHACDHEILCGSCGGQAVEFKLPVHAQPVPSDWSVCTLSVSGLQGGHSGEDIHRGRGNAISILSRVLLALEGQLPLLLGPATGGTFRLAIPRDASAVICFPSQRRRDVDELLLTQQRLLALEFPSTGQNLSISLSASPSPGWCTDPAQILSATLLLPDGICQMNEVFFGLVDTSDNMGELYLNEQELRIVLEIRSAQESLGDYLYRRMRRLAGILGGSCTTDRKYDSWTYQAHSPLREIAGQTYQSLYGSDPSYLTVHAGLEVSFFTSRKTDLDAISLGPTCWNFHSPSEAVSISSARKSYQLLCAILERCR